MSPPPTLLQSPSEDQQSFVTLTPPLAFSLDGEEYVLSLAEDEGITDLFSSVDLGNLPLDIDTHLLWKAVLEIQSFFFLSAMTTVTQTDTSDIL